MVLVEKLSLCLVGGRFFFICSWKLSKSLGDGDTDDVPTLLFALDMLFLLELLSCDAFGRFKFLTPAFADECCNGDLLDSNEANALFPLFKSNKN